MRKIQSKSYFNLSKFAQNPMFGGDLSGAIVKKPSIEENNFFREQRKLLGAPYRGAQEAGFYISMHEGVFDLKKDPKAKEKFMQFFHKDPRDIEGTNHQEQFIPASEFVGLRADALRQLLKNNTNLIINCIFLPAIDANGETSGPSQTFALNNSNIDSMLAKMKSFAEKQ